MRFYLLVVLFAWAEAGHRTARQASPLFCNLPNGISGICTTAATCQSANSEVVGICGQTRLVCCKAVKTCGASIRMTNSHFVHPHFPATVNDQARCAATVLRPATSMCQLKVEFIDFMLRQPRNGNCTPDSMVFTGTSTPVPPLCGNMTGQHLYLDFEPTNVPIGISIHGDGKIARSWNIKFSYVSCLNKAPKGCLQYHTKSKGTICSFNYKGNVGQTHDEEFIPVRVNRNRILANLTYGTCIKSVGGSVCGIRYSVNENFHVSNRKGAGAGPECMNGNHIVIPSGQEAKGNRIKSTGPFVSSYCGRNLSPKGNDAEQNSYVYSKVPPFVIYHMTGPHQEENTTLNGYCLNYQQVHCERDAETVTPMELTVPSPAHPAGTRKADIIV